MKPEYEDFEHDVALLHERGEVRPGWRVLAYCFADIENLGNALCGFLNAVIPFENALCEALQEGADRDLLDAFPRPRLMERQDYRTDLVLVNNAEALNIALSHIGRPAFQAVFSNEL